MNEEEKESIEEFRKQLRLAINIDDVTTTIRNDNAQTILNLIEKLQKENEELKEDRDKFKKNLLKRITYCNELEEDLFENGSNYVIPKEKVKDKIEELQKEYNKLDKQVDEYIKSVEKDVSTYYENKERISIMQALSYFIDTLQELIEEREEK